MLKNYFWQILSAILLILLLITCHRPKPTPNDIVIVTPPKEGVFKTITPEPIKVPKYIYRTLKGDTIELENPVNLELASKYEELEKAHDSIKMKLTFLQAIEIHKYNPTFEDNNLKVQVFAVTTGTLDSLKVSYHIKPDTIKVHVPQEKFALLLGGGLYNNDTKVGSKLNLGVQLKNGNVISGSYDIINQRIFLDYNFKVFSFKK